MKRLTNRRSIQFFQYQTQRPSADQLPCDATAYRSPVEMRLSHDFCGTNDRSRSPVMARRKFSAKMGPWRTAMTPALGLGLAIIPAASPAAKTPGWDIDCS